MSWKLVIEHNGANTTNSKILTYENEKKNNIFGDLNCCAIYAMRKGDLVA